MKMALSMLLSAILFVIGLYLVVTSPLDAMMITLGLFLVAVSILNIAIQIYFPSNPKETVELKIVVPKKKAKKRSVKRVRKKKSSRKK